MHLWLQGGMSLRLQLRLLRGLRLRLRLLSGLRQLQGLLTQPIYVHGAGMHDTSLGRGWLRGIIYIHLTRRSKLLPLEVPLWQLPSDMLMMMHRLHVL